MAAPENRISSMGLVPLPGSVHLVSLLAIYWIVEHMQNSMHESHLNKNHQLLFVREQNMFPQQTFCRFLRLLQLVPICIRRYPPGYSEIFVLSNTSLLHGCRCLLFLFVLPRNLASYGRVLFIAIITLQITMLKRQTINLFNYSSWPRYSRPVLSSFLC